MGNISFNVIGNTSFNITGNIPLNVTGDIPILAYGKVTIEEEGDIGRTNYGYIDSKISSSVSVETNTLPTNTVGGRICLNPVSGFRSTVEGSTEIKFDNLSVIEEGCSKLTSEKVIVKVSGNSDVIYEGSVEKIIEGTSASEISGSVKEIDVGSGSISNNGLIVPVIDIIYHDYFGDREITTKKE